jgi:hypothetical protein
VSINETRLGVVTINTVSSSPSKYNPKADIVCKYSCLQDRQQILLTHSAVGKVITFKGVVIKAADSNQGKKNIVGSR